MSGKKLTLLLLAAGALIAASAFVLTRQKEDTAFESAGADYAVPGLSDKINALTSMTVGKADAEVALYADEQGVWRVRQLSDYAANRKKIRQFLFQLAASKRIEKKTADPALLSRISLDDKAGIRVKAQAKGEEKPVFDVVIGDYDGAFKGTFLRNHGEDQSWLVSDKLAPEANEIYWVLTEILHVDRARIWQVHFKHEGKPDVEIVRKNPGGDFLLKNIPSGRKATSNYAIYTLSTGLEGLRFVNVAKAEKLPDPVTVVATFLTLDGLQVEIRLAPGSVKGMHWAQVEARFVPEAIQEDEQAKKLSKSPEEVQKEAEAINARTRGWIYMLEDYFYALFQRTMDEMLQPVEKDKKE